MARPEETAPVDQISARAAAAGVRCAPESAQRIAAFFSLLLAWNEKINLTGARSLKELLDDHLPDSLALAGAIDRQESVTAAPRLVDIGSGGGLPVLPLLCLHPHWTGFLVEPRSRRAAFLREAVRKLGLRAEVQEARLEAMNFPVPADLALSRATFSPQDWLEKACGLVVSGGQVAVFATEAGDVTDVPSWAIPLAPLPYVLPGNRRRELLIFRKAA